MKPRNQVKRFGPGHIERQKYGVSAHYWPKDMLPFILAAGCTLVVLDNSEKARETLTAQKADLEAQLKASQDAFISIPKLEQFVERIQGQLPLLDFEGKRLALDMLGITVWLDCEAVEITGTVDTESDLQKVLPCSRIVDHYACL